MTDHFEDLIRAIEKSSINNVAVISNVRLWADSWRDERDTDIRNEIERIQTEFRDNPFPPDYQVEEHTSCHNEYCAYSSIIGELTPMCESLGCVLKQKNDDK